MSDRVPAAVALVSSMVILTYACATTDYISKVKDPDGPPSATPAAAGCGVITLPRFNRG